MAGALPLTPNNFLAQPGNATVYLSWTLAVGATSYNVLRSTDNITFSTLGSTAATSYTDSTGTVGSLYYYSVQSVNSNGSSARAASQVATVVDYGQQSLGAIRLAAQQRADMVNNPFVTTQEWNSYINQSYAELYDILVQTYADEYFVAAPYSFTTDGRYPGLYDLPAQCYKLMGVDLAIGSSNSGWLTLSKFSFVDRNRYIWGNTPVSFLGILQLKYRLVGSQIELVPQPQTGQVARLWFVPRLAVLLADSDILQSISGWSEYVIVDAAIKALQKEESDCSLLLTQKQMLMRRIESAAANRDAGMAECATDVRRLDGGYLGGPFADMTGGF